VPVGAKQRKKRSAPKAVPAWPRPRAPATRTGDYARGNEEWIHGVVRRCPQRKKLTDQKETSAPDAPKAGDLRCCVRESLIKFLQERYPESLPKMQAEIHGFRPEITTRLKPPSIAAALAGS